MNVEMVNWLATPEAADAMANLVPPAVSVSQIQQLRVRFGKSKTSALLHAADARRKAIEKWGKGDWLVTDRGIQQATDHWIARYKARRITGDTEVWDWCCGVGGEAMQLASQGPLVAIDRDPVVLAMATHNLHVRCRDNEMTESWKTVCGDVFEHQPPTTAWLNIDPDRRSGGRRKTGCDRLEPPLEAWWSFASQSRGASIKLAPATVLPAHCESVSEREWISRAGTCRQQVLWLGDRFQSGAIRATRISHEHTSTTFIATQTSDCECAATCGTYVFDLDPAIRAAGLSTTYADQYGLRCLGDPTGFFTADEIGVAAMAQPFEVCWQGSADMKTIRHALTDLGATVVEVKTRGIPWNPPKVIRQLHRPAATKLTLLASRNPSYSGAILARRMTNVHQDRDV